MRVAIISACSATASLLTGIVIPMVIPQGIPHWLEYGLLALAAGLYLVAITLWLSSQSRGGGALGATTVSGNSANFSGVAHGPVSQIGHYETKTVSGDFLLKSRLLAKYDELQKFICSKEEHELRKTFDYDDMLKFAVVWTTCHHSRKSISPKLFAEMEAYYAPKAGGMMLWDLAKTEWKNGRWVAQMPGNAVTGMNLSIKHVNAVKRIDEFRLDASLPLSIVSVIEEFKSIVGLNADLIVRFMNDMFRKDPHRLVGQYDSMSPFKGNATYLYWHSFKDLRPYVGKIASAINADLNLKDRPYEK